MLLYDLDDHSIINSCIFEYVDSNKVSLEDNIISIDSKWKDQSLLYENLKFLHMYTHSGSFFPCCISISHIIFQYSKYAIIIILVNVTTFKQIVFWQLLYCLVSSFKPSLVHCLKFLQIGVIHPPVCFPPKELNIDSFVAELKHFPNIFLVYIIADELMKHLKIKLDPSNPPVL